jgi:hypothetical protein
MKMQSKLTSIGSKRYGIFGLEPWGYNKEKPQNSNNISSIHRTFFATCTSGIVLSFGYVHNLTVFGSQQCYSVVVQRF